MTFLKMFMNINRNSNHLILSYLTLYTKYNYKIIIIGLNIIMIDNFKIINKRGN
jgi:hypothetical protein